MLLQFFEVLFQFFDECLFSIESFHKLLADSLLMVTKNGNLPICLFIFFQLLLHGQAFEVELLEFVLESGGGVVGPEDFGS